MFARARSPRQVQPQSAPCRCSLCPERRRDRSVSYPFFSGYGRDEAFPQDTDLSPVPRKNVVRQGIVTTPRHVLDAVGECDGNYFAILTEDFTRVNGKGD